MRCRIRAVTPGGVWAPWHSSSSWPLRVSVTDLMTWRSGLKNCEPAGAGSPLRAGSGFTVHGIEPVRRHLDVAAHALETLAAAEPEIAARIRIDQGLAEHLPDPDASIDLIWCRDVLEHVKDLETVFGEFRRVLRPGGHAAIYQTTATDWLAPAEAARLLPADGIEASSLDPQHFEAAIAGSGLTIAQSIELHGERREYAEEDGTGLTSRQLLRVSRLPRPPSSLVASYSATDSWETPVPLAGVASNAEKGMSKEAI
jgi:SAM-dependent methyltransferase